MSYSKELQDIIGKFEYQVRDTDGEVTLTRDEAIQCARIYLEGIIASNPTNYRRIKFGGDALHRCDNKKHFRELLNELNDE